MSSKIFGFVSNFKGTETVANVPELLGDLDPADKVAIEHRLEHTPPFIAANVSGTMPRGQEVNGHFALVPLTAEQMLTLPRSQVLFKIELAINLLDDAGCDVVGLGSLTGSALTASGELLARRVRVPLTSGNTFAALATSMSVEKIVARLGLDLSDMTISVIGATGSVGYAVSYELGKKCKKLLGIARHVGRLKSLQSDVENSVVSTEITDAFGADIVVVTTAASEYLVTPEMVKPGTLIIDETQPRNCSPLLNNRDDVLVIDGAMISVPEIDLGMDMACPPKTIYACYAETMMLSLEGVTEHFHLGRVDPRIFPELRALAKQYGLDLAAPTSFDKPVTEEHFDRFASVKSAC